MKNFAAGLTRDQQVAERLGIRFEVCTQKGRAQPWQTVAEDITRMAEVLKLANELDAAKVAVFTDGYHDWGSDYPELLNASVLELD